MRSIVTIILAILIGASAQSAHALIRVEASELPLEEVAKRALGDVGALVVDFERPRPVKNAQEFNITFYTKAVPGGLVWDGICSTQKLELTYTVAGRLKYLSQQTLYGVRGELKKQVQGPGWLQSRALEAEACAKVTDVKKFFRAPSSAAAEIAALAVDKMNVGLSNDKPPFEFKCQSQIIPVCLATHQVMYNAFNVSVRDCSTHHPINDVDLLDHKSCLDVSFVPTNGTAWGVSLTAIYDDYGNVTLKSVDEWEARTEF